MSYLLKNSFFFFVSLFLSYQVLAQTLTVNPSNAEVGTQQSFELSYALEGAGLRDFQAPSLSDFRIVGGPNQSQSIQFVNGSVSRSVTLSYILQPKRTGTFTIAPATATTDNGKTVRSGKATVRVIQGSSTQAQRPSSPFGNMPPFGFPPNMPQPAPSAPQTTTTPRVWLKAIVDQSKVYQGQQVTVTYRIFTNVDVLSYNLDNAASFTGFWVEEMTTPQNRQNTIINGENFTTVDLKKYALFAQRSGILTIDQIGGKAEVRIADPNAGFFGSFGQTETINLKSDTTTVQVLPLPQPQPPNFTGGVGSFSAQIQTDKQTLAANESFKLQLRVAGEGNTKLISQPNIEFPASFEHFDPQVTENVTNAGDAIVGNKMFEYTIVPTETGNFEIPAIKFSYFDPKEQQYKSIEQPAIQLQITPSATANTNENQLSEADSHLSLQSPTKPLLQYALYWLGWALPLAFFAFRWIKSKLNPTIAPNPALVLQQQAAATALAQINKAQLALASNNTRLFYEQMQQTLRQYVSHKFGLSVGWAKDDATKQLKTANVSDNNIAQLWQLLDQCENNAYLPNIAHTASDQLSTQAQQLLQDIENDTQTESPQKQKMPKAAALGFCLMLYAAQLFAADSSQQMQQALSLYNNAQYTQAAVMYEAILKTEQQSAALYYNLGNCYYRLKQTAPAVLNYERALQLSPNNTNIQHNLALANERVTQKTDVLPQLTIMQVWLRCCNLLNTNAWATIALLFMWIWAAFILQKKALLNKQLATQKRFINIPNLLLLASLWSVGAAYTLYYQQYVQQFAIVNKPEIIVRELPTETSPSVVELSAGAKVNVLDSHADWWQIQLGSGQKGWIEGKNLVPI